MFKGFFLAQHYFYSLGWYCSSASEMVVCSFLHLLFFFNCGKIYMQLTIQLFLQFSRPYSSVVWSIFILLCSQHHHPSPELCFLSWKSETLYQLNNNLPFSLPFQSLPDSHHSTFCFYAFDDFIKTSYKWNRSIRLSVTGLFSLANYLQHSSHLLILLFLIFKNPS